MFEAEAYRRAAQALEDAEMWRRIAMLMPWARSQDLPPFVDQEARGLRPLPPEWYEQNARRRRIPRPRPPADQQPPRARLHDMKPAELKRQLQELRKQQRQRRTPARTPGPRPPAA